MHIILLTVWKFENVEKLHLFQHKDMILTSSSDSDIFFYFNLPEKKQKSWNISINIFGYGMKDEEKNVLNVYLFIKWN